jgi:hypothetical protein
VETIENKTASITALDHSIILYQLKEGSVIELEDSIAMYEETKRISGGKKYASLVDARATTTLTKEAREWSAKPEIQKNLIAQAIVVTSLANRLVGNFIITFHKPKAPTKLFSSMEKAKEWLIEKIKGSSEKKKSSSSVKSLV